MRKITTEISLFGDIAGKLVYEYMFKIAANLGILVV
jgi:hypothetical protein